MATFSIQSKGRNYTTQGIEVASATVIPAGSLVALDGSKLGIAAVAASTAVAYCEDGSADGETTTSVTVGNDFELKGTGDAVFAESMRGTEVDITNAQLIDVGASSTDVLKISAAETAGTVDSTADIVVRINKPIF